MYKRGDPHPSGHTWRQMTLGELTKRRQNVRMSCQDCGREVIHSPVFIAMFGGVRYELTLWQLAQRLQCSKCGSRRVGIEPTSG